jgi:putative cardiolipin synthase
VLAALSLGACVHPDKKAAAPASTYWDRPEATEFGRRLAPRLADHPGKSGLYVLGPGLDAFAARLLLIDGAERAVDVQYYIFHDDLTGRFLLSRLLKAADRGARVRLLLDDVGSGGIDRLIAAANAHPELEVRLFNPVARGPGRLFDLLWRAGRLNHRMHNKMLTADGTVAVVGGRNVGDEYFDAAEGVNFADLDLLAVGPVLGELGTSFDRYWNSPFAVPVSAFSFMRGSPEALVELRKELAAHEAEHRGSSYAERVRQSDLVQAVGEGRAPLLWAPTRAVADLPEKVVAKGDAIEPTLMRRQLGPFFEDTRSDLIIVSPYFVPRDAGVTFLTGLRARGVRVRILTNSLSATDVPAVHAGYAPHRKPLLQAGVELFELKQTGEQLRSAKRAGVLGSSTASLHAKTFSFDGQRVFVGSLNLDPRSIVLNTELGLLVESEELAQLQADGFERATAPGVSWRLHLEGEGRSEHIVWEGVEDGRPERITKEPHTTWWDRFSVSLLGLLPIEGQL